MANTYTHNVPRDTQGGRSLGQESGAILTRVGLAHPLNRLMGYEHQEDAVGGGGSKQWQTHTHTHIHIVPRETQGGWSIGQGSAEILTQVSVAPH